jgi:hypothetical protein
MPESLTRFTRKFDNDFKYGVFRLSCRGLPERIQDEVLVLNPLRDRGNDYRHAVDILNVVHGNEFQ